MEMINPGPYRRSLRISEGLSVFLLLVPFTVFLKSQARCSIRAAEVKGENSERERIEKIIERVHNYFDP